MTKTWPNNKEFCAVCVMSKWQQQQKKQSELSTFWCTSFHSLPPTKKHGLFRIFFKELYLVTPRCVVVVWSVR
jgi:hypothetical protein